MNFLEAIILGLIQGLTEFIPVSSSGHLVIAREFLGFSTENGLAVDAVLQLATALAVLTYFCRDFKTILKDKILMIAITLGTIPAVVFGLLLESRMETVFRSTEVVAWTLLLGALLMYVAERFGSQDKELSVKKGFIVGLFQSLALIPGISRSGATISGGLFMGLTREAATRFSFLLSVPIIAGSGLKKLSELSTSGILIDTWPVLLFGSIAAFASGLWAIGFLLRYLKTSKLTVFIWYRIILAIFLFILLQIS